MAAGGTADERGGRFANVSAAGRSAGVTFVGLGAAVVALLTLLQGELSALHLYADMTVLLGLLIGGVVALIVALQTARSERGHEADQARELAAAIAGSATRELQDRDHADFGLPPVAPVTAEPTPGALAQLDEALRTSWSVVVVGGEPIDRARVALAALTRARPQARVICPVDAVSLGKILDQQSQLVRALADHAARARRQSRSRVARLGASLRYHLSPLRGHPPRVPVVLWLDDVVRFIDGLDIDAACRLMAQSDGASPAAAAGGGHGSSRRDDVPLPEAQVRLVATIEQTEYEAALAARDDGGHRTRRLLALSTVVVLAAAGPAAATPIAGVDAEPAPVREDDAEPTPVRSPPLIEDLRPVGTALVTLSLLGAVVTVLVVLLGLAWVGHGGWTAPPSLADQQEAIEQALPACDEPTPPQSAGALHDDQDWVLPVQRGSCPASDYVAVYSVHAGRLNWVLDEGPKPGDQAWYFRCAGAAGGCLLRAGGSRTILVGSFTATRGPRLVSLPVVLYRYGSADDLRLLAPDLPPPTGASSAAADRAVPPSGPGEPDAGRVVLPLAPGAVEPVGGRGGCTGVAQLCGDPATYVAAISIGADGGGPDQVLIIAGYADGPWYSPSRVLTQAFALQYRPAPQGQASQVAFEAVPCTAHVGGQPLAALALAHPGAAPATVEDAMRAAWERAAVSCPSPLS